MTIVLQVCNHRYVTSFHPMYTGLLSATWRIIHRDLLFGATKLRTSATTAIIDCLCCILITHFAIVSYDRSDHSGFFIGTSRVVVAWSVTRWFVVVSESNLFCQNITRVTTLLRTNEPCGVRYPGDAYHAFMLVSGVASYGALGHVPYSTSNTLIFFS